MLEVLGVIENSPSDAHELLLSAEEEYPGLLNFLHYCATDCDNFIGERKIHTALNYFHLGKSDGEVGELMERKARYVKQRHPNLWHVKNVKFLLDTYKKLKWEISAGKQYYFLYNAMCFLSGEDVKWFARILCKKVDWKFLDSKKLEVVVCSIG